MKDRRRIAFAFGCIVLFSVLASCSKKPGEAAFDNPFDPDGDFPGEGYGIAAVFQGDSVKITFVDPDPIVEYRLYHSTISGDFDDMTEILAEEFSFATSKGTGTIGHRGFAAESTNWYRVRGRATKVIEGVEVPVDLLPSVPVSVDLQILGRFPTSTTTTRAVTLQVLTGGASSVEISNDEAFTTSQTFSVTPGAWTDLEWQLPVSAEPLRKTESFDVFFRPLIGAAPGEARSASIQRSVTAALYFERGIRNLPTSALVDSILVVKLSPATAMEGFVEAYVDELDAQSEVLRSFGPLLSLEDSVIVSLDVDDVSERKLSGYFRRDFQDSVRVDVVKYTPAAAIQNAALSVVGGTTVSSTALRLAITADGAGYYALSEAPDFSGAEWMPWPTGTFPSATDTVDFEISGTLGSHRVYAAFSNPFVPEPSLASVEVELVVPPAQTRR